MILNETLMKKILIEEFDKRLDFLLKELTVSYKSKNGDVKVVSSNAKGLRLRNKKTGDEFEFDKIVVDPETNEEMCKLLIPGAASPDRVGKVRKNSRDLYSKRINSGGVKKGKLVEKEEVEGENLSSSKEKKEGDYILVSLKDLEDNYEL